MDLFIYHSAVHAEDLDLVRRCVDGTAGAWEKLMKRAGPAIRRGAGVALRKFRIKDREVVEDVHQQVYLELLRDDRKVLRTYQGRSDLEGWLAVISMRSAYRILRIRVRDHQLPEILPAEEAPAHTESAEHREFLGMLDAAFRRLSPQERALLRMSFYEKLSYKEISDALGMPVNSVSPKLIRARERLKKYLE